ncbi:hypothetical protein DFH11DRAFT_900984 [Phellopilus nigrolimitatus]|nr:hypothetical protein DFH11DRAFT_900984 [Phellopilus nigrolimitatus]
MTRARTTSSSIGPDSSFCTWPPQQRVRSMSKLDKNCVFRREGLDVVQMMTSAPVFQQASRRREPSAVRSLLFLPVEKGTRTENAMTSRRPVRQELCHRGRLRILIYVLGCWRHAIRRLYTGRTVFSESSVSTALTGKDALAQQLNYNGWIGQPPSSLIGEGLGGDTV